MQRDIFQDFVAKLSEHCENVLIGSEIDYRRLKVKSHFKDKQVNVNFQRPYSMVLQYIFVLVNLFIFSLFVQVHYFWPLDGFTQTEYENLWHKFINEYGERITTETIPVMFGRCVLSHLKYVCLSYVGCC